MTHLRINLKTIFCEYGPWLRLPKDTNALELQIFINNFFAVTVSLKIDIEQLSNRLSRC